MQEYIIPVVCVISIISLLVVHIVMGSRKPFLSSILSLFPGIIVLIIINLTSAYTGVYVPVSPLTTGISALFGIPGITFLLIIPVVF